MGTPSKFNDLKNFKVLISRMIGFDPSEAKVGIIAITIISCWFFFQNNNVVED
jgi:hypothetical protein